MPGRERRVGTKSREEGTIMNKLFVRFANAVAEGSGYPSVFGVAVLTVVVWLATGSVFEFSDTWQLVMNTLTSVITFLMVVKRRRTMTLDQSSSTA
jgi:low affinity Fe/Cu permease